MSTTVWIFYILAGLAGFGIFWKLFLARKGRRQPCYVVTEDNRIVKSDINLKLGHLVLDREMESYVYCPEILCYEGGTSSLVALLDERDAMPIAISGKAEAKRATYTTERINKIAQSCHDRALIETERKNNKNPIVTVMSFILGAFALVTLIVVLIGIYA